MLTYGALFGREFYLLPRIASVITDVFPNEDVSGLKKSSVLSVCKKPLNRQGCASHEI